MSPQPPREKRSLENIPGEILVEIFTQMARIQYYDHSREDSVIVSASDTTAAGFDQNTPFSFLTNNVLAFANKQTYSTYRETMRNYLVNEAENVYIYMRDFSSKNLENFVKYLHAKGKLTAFFTGADGIPAKRLLICLHTFTSKCPKTSRKLGATHKELKKILGPGSRALPFGHEIISCKDQDKILDIRRSAGVVQNMVYGSRGGDGKGAWGIDYFSSVMICLQMGVVSRQVQHKQRVLEYMDRRRATEVGLAAFEEEDEDVPVVVKEEDAEDDSMEVDQVLENQLEGPMDDEMEESEFDEEDYESDEEMAGIHPELLALMQD